MMRRRQNQRGQGMVEYVLAVAAVLGIFFVPIVPNPNTGELVPIIFLFIESFDIYINSFHAVIALPVP